MRTTATSAVAWWSSPGGSTWSAASVTSRVSKTSRRSPLGAANSGTPVYLRDVANVQLGPDIRRGVAELNGQGEVVGGVVVVRYGENALGGDRSRERVRSRRSSARCRRASKMVPIYDRSDLIRRSVDTLKDKLIEEMLIVSLVCIIFLFHFRSALVIILTLPVAILLALSAMTCIGLDSNIMSLGGIAIAIGAMVDAAIIMMENAHKHLEHWESRGQGRGPQRGHYRRGARGRAAPSSSPCWSSRSLSCRCSPWRRRKGGCSSRWPSPRPSPCLRGRPRRHPGARC